MPQISLVQWVVAGGFAVLLVIALILKSFEAKKKKPKKIEKTPQTKR